MRKADIKRKTKETDIAIEINLDGTGKYKINTSIPFMDHMLSQLALHGGFDIHIEGYGDTDIDFHHLVEDLGISLGKAFKESIGDKKGITRYGYAAIPMDETLISTAVDISGRPFFVYNVDIKKGKIGDFDTELLREFFQAFSNHFGINLHINMFYGKNAHHIAEGIFKSFSLSLKTAVAIINSNKKKVPSTKGSL